MSKTFVITDIEGDFELFLKSLQPYFKVMLKNDGNTFKLTAENYKNFILDPDNIPENSIYIEAEPGSEDITILNLGDLSKSTYSKIIVQLILQYNVKHKNAVRSLNGNRDINQISPLIDLPRLGELYQNEIQFINPNGQIDIDRLLMDSSDATRYQQQYVEGMSSLHHVDPSKDSFLLYLLNNPSVDGVPLCKFEDSDIQLVGEYRKALNVATKAHTVVDPKIKQNFSDRIQARLKTLQQSQILATLQAGIQFDKPLTPEQTKLVTAYYKWLTVNSIGEPDFFREALAVYPESIESTIAVDRLMESLPHAYRQALDPNAAERNGVFFDQLRCAAAEIKENNVTFTHALAQQNNVICIDANTRAVNALNKLNNNETLNEDDLKALSKWRLLSQPKAVSFYHTTVSASAFCANPRKIGEAVPTPIPGEVVVHGHASHNPVVTITENGAVISLDATYRLFGTPPVKHPVSLLITKNEDNTSCLDLQFSVQFGKTTRDIQLSLLAKDKGIVEVLDEKNNPLYGTVVEYNLEGKAKKSVISHIDVNTQQIFVAGYETTFDCNEQVIKFANITKCHRMGELKKILTVNGNTPASPVAVFTSSSATSALSSSSSSSGGSSSSSSWKAPNANYTNNNDNYNINSPRMSNNSSNPSDPLLGKNKVQKNRCCVIN